jgi:hypothetical protein
MKYSKIRLVLDNFFIISFSAALMLFPSIKYEISLVDGPDTPFFGFPLPWNSKGLALSMTKDFYLIPLVIDLIFYYFVSRLILKYFSFKISTLPRNVKLILNTFIYLYALAGLFVFTLTLTLFEDNSFDIWYKWPVERVLWIMLGTSI